MSESLQTNVYTFDEYRVDTEKRLLFRGGETVDLTSKVFDTLLYLVANKGRVLSKDEMMSVIWNDSFVEENNLNKNISTLRQVLGEKPGENRFIATVPGKGFKFVAEVTSTSKTSAQARDGIDDAGREKTRYSLPPRLVLAAAVLIVAVLGSAAVYLYRQSSATQAVTPRAIAVLPFLPIVPENRDEALEMGMADTLIERLSRTDAVVVVRPLSSVRRFYAQERDAIEAGKKLGVDAVLDGNIQRWGDQVRVNVRLINVSDGASIWSGSFNEGFTNIFALQDSIAEKVARSLKLKFRDEVAGSERPAAGTDNLNAYQNYMRGRFLSQKLVLAETRKGIAYYEAAIKEDPQYALAYVALADAYRSLPLANDLAPTENFTKAKQAAERALEIDPALSEAHAILGFIVFWYDWDWTRSEKHLQDALNLDPNSADAHFFYAHLNSNLGRHDRALEHVRRAREIDPVDLRLNALESQFLIYAGRAEEAIKRSQQTAELNPNFWMPPMLLCSANIELENYSVAAEHGRHATELPGTASIASAFQAVALARSGDKAAARVILDKLMNPSGEQYASPYNVGLVYNALGERENALTWLERGFEERDPRMAFLRVEPKWNTLRSEERFTKLLANLNLRDNPG